MINLDDLQKEIHSWANENFGSRKEEDILLNITSEFGIIFEQKLEEIVPLLHASRQASKICSYRKYDDKLKKSLGTLMIHILDYCSLRKWSYNDILKNTWEDVSNREWIHDPLNGLSKYKK